MEKHYAFIKDGVVENTLVFTDRNDAFAQVIAEEYGYDSFVWLDDAEIPARWSSYNGKTFAAPTNDYLISIGILSAEVVNEAASE
jgi:hypothetical protein